MKVIQIILLIGGVLLFLYTFVKFMRKKYRRIDLLVFVLLSGAFILTGLFPQIQDFIADFFTLGNRLFASLIVSVIILFLICILLFNRSNENRRTIGELVRSLAAKAYLEGKKSKNKIDILITIPAYNEEKNIAEVLKKIPRKVEGFKVGIVVVEDGGTDKTAEVVKSVNIPVTSHIINRGQGDSIRTGFDIAVQSGAKVVVNMDADGQHRAEDLPKLVLPILKDKADFVKGSRFLGSHEGTSKLRGVGIHFFSYLLSFLLRDKITDATNGYRAVRISKLPDFTLTEKQFSAPEILIEAYKNNLRVREIPVTIKDRTSGASKKPKLFYPIGFLWTIVKVWLR